MRLEELQSRHGLKQRLMLQMMKLTLGAKKLDGLRTMLHRPEYLGAPFGKLSRQIMRGPSEWSEGERELMAAFVSKVNECPFCAGSHSAVADEALGEDVSAKVLEDYESAPISEKLRATLGFMKRVTLTPDEVTAEHASVVLAAGVSHEALEDALHVVFLFNVVDRLANTLGWEVLDKKTVARFAKISLRFGFA